MQFIVSVPSWGFFPSLGAPAQVCICPGVSLVPIKPITLQGRLWANFLELHINKYSMCYSVLSKSGWGMWVGILLHCEQQTDLCLLLQIVGGEAGIWNPGQLHFHIWIHAKASGLPQILGAVQSSFIVSACSLIQRGLHVDSPPISAYVTSSLQEPEPMLVHDTYHLAAWSLLVCWSCSH